MNCYIKKIMVFGRDRSSRCLRLTKGLNVVTGSSKSGKSALIEIVDYCLCSSLSTIPKGIISSYGKLFSVVFRLKNGYLVIGRPAWDDEGASKIYVKFERDYAVVKNISVDYFDKLSLVKIKGAGQEDIERHLGLRVGELSREDLGRKSGKASLRNMTPFLYQYQNLIASKHALFSKLDDFYKRRDIIDQIPVFLGLVDDDYFSLKRQIDDVQARIKRLEKDAVKSQQEIERYINRLFGLYANYYSLVNVTCPSFSTIEELVNARDNLPELDKNYYLKSDNSRRYHQLGSRLSEIQIELGDINKKIKSLQATKEYASQAVSHYHRDISKNAVVPVDGAECPVCTQKVTRITESAGKVTKALDVLNKEISSMASFARYDDEQIEALNGSRRKIIQEIRLVESQIRDLDKFEENIRKYKNISDSLGYARVQIDFIVDQVKSGISDDNGEIQPLKKELSDLKDKISQYDFDAAIRHAESNLHKWMSNLCNLLDFEEDFRPAKLYMSLNDLALHHQDHKYGTVTLSDMGSGANWLAFHLSAALGMLRLFCSYPKSCMPSFLFLDQPSQVYFPDSYSQVSEDTERVQEIYINILREIHRIRADAGYYPQVIVLDHAVNLNLGEYNFSKFIRANWHADNALI